MLRIFLAKDISSPEILARALKQCNIPSSPVVKNNFGKPYLANQAAFFSISHCQNLTICVVSDVEIGIDLEENTLKPRVVKRAFTANEQATLAASPDPAQTFTEIWTLKEAFAKSDGQGLSMGLRNIETINDITANVETSNIEMMDTKTSEYRNS